MNKSIKIGFRNVSSLCQFRCFFDTLLFLLPPADFLLDTPSLGINFQLALGGLQIRLPLFITLWQYIFFLSFSILWLFHIQILWIITDLSSHQCKFVIISMRFDFEGRTVTPSLAYLTSSSPKLKLISAKVMICARSRCYHSARQLWNNDTRPLLNSALFRFTPDGTKTRREKIRITNHRYYRLAESSTRNYVSCAYAFEWVDEDHFRVAEIQSYRHTSAIVRHYEIQPCQLDCDLSLRLSSPLSLLNR